MPINLSKGQKVDLTKKNPGLKKIMVGLGWDVNAFDSGSDFDLDAAAFMLGANGKCPTEKEFIFYGNLKHASESVEHMGDNLTGEGEGGGMLSLYAKVYGVSNSDAYREICDALAVNGFSPD